VAGKSTHTSEDGMSLSVDDAVVFTVDGGSVYTSFVWHLIIVADLVN